MSETPGTMDTRRIVRAALLTGGIALLVSIIGAFFDMPGFFRAYLWAWWLLVCIALGSLGVTLVHHLTGGAWGFPIRRIGEAAALTLPLLALLWVPLVFAAPMLYSWAGATPPDGMTPTLAEAIRHKAPYLNVPFFTVRGVIYFALWYGIAAALRRWSLRQDRTGDPAITARFQRFCGPALAVYVALASLAAVDWLMSLEPEWSSTMFGFLVVSEQGLCAFAWAIIALVLVRETTKTTPFSARHSSDSGSLAPMHFWDLGSLMFAFLLLWAYMSFAQFLIIWNGNLPDEVLYFRHRAVAGWQWVGFGLIGLHFFLPFLLLIWGGVKRRPVTLGMVAVFVLAMRAMGAMWEIKPAFGVPQGNVSIFDIALPVALGGLWVALWARHLGAAPLLPLRDPRLQFGEPTAAELVEAAAPETGAHGRNA